MVREVLVGATAFLYLAFTTVTATPAPQADAPAIAAQSDTPESKTEVLRETGV